MNRLTDEQLTDIRKRAEAAKEIPFYTWEASELIEQDVPKLLAEIERLRTDRERLIAELKKADIFSEELERKYFAAKWQEVEVSIKKYAAKMRRERNGSDL